MCFPTGRHCLREKAKLEFDEPVQVAGSATSHAKELSLADAGQRDYGVDRQGASPALNDISVLSKSYYVRSLSRDKAVIWRMSINRPPKRPIFRRSAGQHARGAIARETSQWPQPSRRAKPLSMSGISTPVVAQRCRSLQALAPRQTPTIMRVD